MKNISNVKTKKEYEIHLYEKERSSNTIKKYVRDIEKFLTFMDEIELNKQEVLRYKEYLLQEYEANSVNSMIASVNGYLEWCGYCDLKIKPVKIQKNIFENCNNKLNTFCK